MLLALGFHFGLAPEDGYLYPLFTWLEAALSSLVVMIGGWPFFRAAWRAFRLRTLHLDVPIALGIFSVFSLSWGQLLGGRGARLCILIPWRCSCR